MKRVGLTGNRSLVGHRGTFRRVATAALLLTATIPLRSRAATPIEGRPPVPWTEIKLEALGFYGVSRPFLEAGSSMLSVHFLDGEHVLVTHSLRSLVPRRRLTAAEALEVNGGSDVEYGKDDRLVGAEVLALPSGKVLARTVWHTHDHGRYLWSLGGGRFLVRVGRELSVIAPLARLGTPDPFLRARLPSRPGALAAVVVSPETEVLTLETQVRPRKERHLVLAPTPEEEEDERRSHEVHLDFYRLHGEGTEASPLRLEGAGSVLAPEPLALPLDSDGFLMIGEGRRGTWPISFHEFGGKAQTIGPVLSSCTPRLQLLSRSQFLVFACQGSEDRLKLQAYGFDGHENWEETLGASTAPAVFAFAADAGRFAISRMTPNYQAAGSNANPSTGGNLQDLRVYQTESGDLLFKMLLAPGFRLPENFDLSADGRLFAVVRGALLDIYELPKASSRDLKDLQEAKNFAPPHASGPIELSALGARASRATAAAQATVERNEEAVPGTSASSSAGASAAAAPARVAEPLNGTGPDPTPVADPAGTIPASTQTAADRGSNRAAPSAQAAAIGAAANGPVGADEGASGDGDTVRRRPPTLLNPGEKPENGKPEARKPSPPQL